MTKPFLMITLAYYAWYALEHKRQLANVLAFALMFSWVGDILLIFGSKTYFFLAGVGAFGVAHALYIFIFATKSVDGQPQRPSPLLVPLVCGYLFFAVGYGYFLWENVGGMKLPVAIYCGLIAFMTMAAMLRHKRTSSKSFILVLLGSLLFTISDSILAFGKFVSELPFNSLLVMGTYILAQWLIAEGLIEHGRGGEGHQGRQR